MKIVVPQVSQIGNNIILEDVLFSRFCTSNGAPRAVHDIRLGDIVVSQPTNGFGGVVQYDLGKTITDGRFIRTGSLNGPPSILLNALSALQAINPTRLGRTISAMVEEAEKKDDRFGYPGQGADRLFRADYDHITGQIHIGDIYDLSAFQIHRGDTCDLCDPLEEVRRKVREHSHPFIHYGLILL